MLKSYLLLVASLLAVSATVAPARVVGSDAQACLSGKPSMLVRVSGFKRGTGTVKVAVYAAKGYLARRASWEGRGAVSSTAPIDICIAVQTRETMPLRSI